MTTGAEAVVLVASPSLFLEDGVQLRVIKNRQICASVRSLFVKMVVFLFWAMNLIKNG